MIKIKVFHIVIGLAILVVSCEPDELKLPHCENNVPYFPLAVGNTWIYEKTVHVAPDVPEEMPSTTITYDTLIIEHLDTINGLLYYQTNLDEYYRVDNNLLYKAIYFQETFYDEHLWIDFSRPEGHIDQSWHPLDFPYCEAQEVSFGVHWNKYESIVSPEDIPIEVNPTKENLGEMNYGNSLKKYSLSGHIYCAEKYPVLPDDIEESFGSFTPVKLFYASGIGQVYRAATNSGFIYTDWLLIDFDICN